MKNKAFSHAKRAGRYGTRALIGAALLLAALILLNVGASLLPAGLVRHNITTPELSDMSAKSEALVSGLSEDVTVYWLCEGDTVDTSMIGEWFALLLDHYDEASRHLTVKRIDPAKDTSFVKEKMLEDYSNHSVYVESARRSVAIDVTELFTYSNSYLNQVMYSGQEITMSADEMYNMCQSLYASYGMDVSGYVYNHSSLADAKLAAAVDYVTREAIPHGYLLTGYAGDTPSDTLKEYLGLVTDTLGVLDISKATAIPADANCLVLFAPTADLTDEQTAMLRLYLNGGGSLVMATSPASIQNCPNIQSLAADFGLSALPGLVQDNKSGNYVSGTSVDVLSLSINTKHELSSMLSSQKFRMPQSHAIAAAANLPTGVTVSPLLSTSEQASRVEVGNVSNTLGDGVILNVAMTAQKKISSGDGDVTAKLVWFGSTEAFSEETAEATEGSEYVCFAILFSSVSQSFASEYDAIAAVSLASSMPGAMEAWPLIILSTVLMLLPIGLLITGIVIWFIRKRRH